MAQIASPLSLIRPFTAFRFASGCGVGFGAAPRRLFLGVGASFLDQLRRMNSSNSSRLLTALAWPKQGVSPVEQVLKHVEWPDKFPFKDEDFSRFDESVDSLFYSESRFVTHIDDPAISALTKFYSKVFPPSNTPGVCLLDLCSSWVSHYPVGYKQDRIVGMGMNEDELKRNPVLTDYIVQDLNVNPKLPFEDNSFDVITNVVSVDYLTKPIDVFKEMQRILKPEGLAIMSSIQPSKSDLQTYMEKRLYLCNNESFDVLEWWKMSTLKYPILSKMAKDVLTILITTVASESAFSAGGRVLDDYRSSLSPKTVNALVCMASWIRGVQPNIKNPLQELMEEENLYVKLPKNI